MSVAKDQVSCLSHKMPKNCSPKSQEKNQVKNKSQQQNNQKREVGIEIGLSNNNSGHFIKTQILIVFGIEIGLSKTYRLLEKAINIKRVVEKEHTSEMKVSSSW